MANGSMDITSANATMCMYIETLYPSGFWVQQFSTDQMYSNEARDITETRMGVDGHMAAGYTPNIKTLTISLEANSPSHEQMQELVRAMDINRAIYEITVVIRIPSLNQVRTFFRGVLKNAKDIPDAKKVMDPQDYQFHFESVEYSNI